MAVQCVFRIERRKCQKWMLCMLTPFFAWQVLLLNYYDHEKKNFTHCKKYEYIISISICFGGYKFESCLKLEFTKLLKQNKVTFGN